MKYITLLLSAAFIILLSASPETAIKSGVYEWQNLSPRKNKNGDIREILKDQTRSLDIFEIKAVTLERGKSLKKYKIPEGFDELIIIKSGSAGITVNKESGIMGEGSIVVASQEDLVKISNRSDAGLTFYSLRFKPKSGNQGEAKANMATPLFRDWNNIEFKAGPKGGKRDIMRQPTSALKELEIHTTALNEGIASHAAHTHPDEEIILVRFGTVEETINGVTHKAGPGSVIFLSNDDNHSIRNAGEGQCEYYAIRWITNP